eukprot:TRINITY_DN3058_c0_g1_i1.p1 TRINITY_DN3058_c0_g1~~TRINITY_DN3058_c0_g1_i1.p1  ORF type:complete len:349 (+),score=79.84 TRINITY_DN3058_c0_g1_i1:146-1192(+)
MNSRDEISLSFDAGLTAPQQRRGVGVGHGGAGMVGSGPGGGAGGMGLGGYGGPGGAPYSGQPMMPQQSFYDSRGTGGAPSGYGYGLVGPGPGGAAALGSGPGSQGGPAMAFMSFDLGSTSGTFAPPPRTGGIGGGSYGVGAFDDEPPLLEELGINIPLILRKVVSVLHPLRLQADVHEDGDLSGPILICLLFGLFQLLGGKVHFGVILGWASVSSSFLYIVFNMLVGGSISLLQQQQQQPKPPGPPIPPTLQQQQELPPQLVGSLDLYRCCSLVGYSLLPLMLFSALSLFIPQRSLFAYATAAMVVAWSSRTCSGLLVHLMPQAEEHRFLLLYASALIFAAFTLLVLF